MQYLSSYIENTSQLHQLEKIFQYYMGKVSSLNFTAHRNPQDFEVLNIIDSIAPFVRQPSLLTNANTILDIGTGGGFPGIPLSILFPHQKLSLSDSVGKKMELIRELVKNFHIDNVTLYPGRFEELARIPKLRESFDVVLSRAVAKWPTLLEYALPFVKVGGWLYAYQGEAVLNELENSQEIVQELGGEYKKTISYTLPEEKGVRYLVCIQKTKSTPNTYPRAVGIPKKTPLSAS